MTKKPNPVDLRSDTVTRPTQAMREAMARAEVGDDVYGEDPTVNRLQERAAELFGREAGLFLPTGSMGNLIALRMHGEPGSEVICDARSHVPNFELASSAAIAGMLVRTVATADGHLRWADIEPVLPPKAYYRAQARVVVLENTHNMAGGTLMPEGVQEEVCREAHQRGLQVHLDGARLFNASVATGKSVRELSEGADSVMFSFSKGLGAPIGAMLVAGKEFIEKARIYRKMFGGGMRQVGVVGAAAEVALEQGPAALAQDHKNARRLAEGLGKIPGISLDLESVHTNILVFDVSGTRMSAPEFEKRLKAGGVLAGAINTREVRMVTHYDVDEAGIERALEATAEVVKAA